ncbi:hypothetical protein [Paracoccus sp. (in: a-proteobacteria)]|uniref:hypothetical protein n=1 Tax=Paracoccus sp. TaxID=267 RepID=UPI0034CE5DCA
MKSGAGWLACAAPEEVETFLASLSENALVSLPWIFDFWAMPHQLPPEGDWKSWVIMGGRGGSIGSADIGGGAKLSVTIPCPSLKE